MKAQKLNAKSDTYSRLSPALVTAATDAADLDDPFLKEIVAMPADRLAEWLTPDMLVELPKRIDIPRFAAADVSVEVIDIHPLPDQVYVCIDFCLHEAPTKTCRKGRTLDGEATIIFLPERKAILDVWFAEEVRNDSDAVVTTQLSVKPVGPN